MAKPGVYNLAVVRGDTHILNVEFNRGVDSSTWIATVRAEEDDPTGYQAVCTTPSFGIVRCVWSALDAANFQRGWVWDLEETASGVVTTRLKGHVNVIKDVSYA